MIEGSHSYQLQQRNERCVHAVTAFQYIFKGALDVHLSLNFKPNLLLELRCLEFAAAQS